jgi:hypothetical protein
MSYLEKNIATTPLFKLSQDLKAHHGLKKEVLCSQTSLTKTHKKFLLNMTITIGQVQTKKKDLDLLMTGKRDRFVCCWLVWITSISCAYLA